MASGVSRDLKMQGQEDRMAQHVITAEENARGSARGGARTAETSARMAKVRRYVAKKQMREGCVLVATLMVQPSGVVPSITAGSLVRAISYFGRTKTLMVLDAAGVEYDRKIGSLSDEQRSALRAALTEYAFASRSGTSRRGPAAAIALACPSSHRYTQAAGTLREQ